MIVCEEPMNECWRRALRTTCELGHGIVVWPEPGYFIVTAIGGMQCAPQDQAAISHEIEEGDPRCVTLSGQDKYDLPLESGWRVWAHEFCAQIRTGRLDALVIVDAARLRDTIVAKANWRGFRLEKFADHDVFRWGPFVLPLELPRQIAFMVYEGRRMEQQAQASVDALALRFAHSKQFARRLAEAFPRWRVLVQDQYLVLQRCRGERGLARSYWSLSDKTQAADVALSDWVRAAQGVFRQRRDILKELPASEPGVPVSLLQQSDLQ